MAQHRDPIMRAATLISFVFGVFSLTANPTLAASGLWTPIGPSAAAVQHLLVDSSNPLFLYVDRYQSPPFLGNVQPGLFWSPMSLPDGTVVSAISVSPTQKGRAYAGACVDSGGNTNCQYYRSNDYGATWSLIYTAATNVVLLSIAEAPSASSTLYAAGNFFGLESRPFVATSLDSGSTWTNVTPVLSCATDSDRNPVGSIVVDPTNPAVAYLGTQCGVLKTTNGGTTWANSGVGVPPGLVTALLIDPANASALYAGVGPTQLNNFLRTGIYKTSDGGNTWNPANTGLTSLKVLSLAFDSRGTSLLWAGTEGGGVFQSTDSGATWAAVNSGLVGGDSLIVTAIASSQVAGSDDVFIGTGNGAFAMTIPPIATEDVIEYYAPALDHYFMTATPAEI
jgi:hypothetical protein